MQFYLFPIFFCLNFIVINSVDEYLSLIPSCLSRNICKSACNCTAAPYCSPLAMNDDIRQNITFHINQIREMQSKGEPKASSLTMLQYDQQLEEISSCWALKCENEFSECFYTPRFTETSQNVGITKRKEPTLNLWFEVISSWLGEMNSLTIENLRSLPLGEDALKIHNLAQLLSDRVRYVGCSWSISPKFVLLVCTFGPKGPLPGQPIFQTGIPCSACPSGYGCDHRSPFEQLCKKIQMYSPPRKFVLPKHSEYTKKRVANVNKPKVKKETHEGNLNHPWAGLYIMLMCLLLTFALLFVLGFAMYCILFY